MQTYGTDLYRVGELPLAVFEVGHSLLFVVYMQRELTQLFATVAAWAPIQHDQHNTGCVL